MPENIIVDTSCLVVLHKIGELDLLKKLYENILITESVAKEFGFSLPNWITVTKSEKEDKEFLRKYNLDSGELSVIALAKDKGGLLILDDLKARVAAADLNLDYTGTLGTLVEAKLSGHLSSLKRVLDQIKLTNFYLSEELEDKLLQMVGEN